MAEADWRTLDRAALSAAYDNSGAVAGSAATVAGWRERSAAFREAHPGELDLPYGPQARQRIDVFRCGAAGAPMLAFLHGGYWQRNAKEGFACMAEGPLARGLDVALIGYTLAPDATMTAIGGEVRAALAFLRSYEGERGGKPRLVVAGWSAGGHLAALALSAGAADAGLAVSGIFDLAPIRGTVLNDALTLTEAETDALSPIRHLPEASGPLTVAYGAGELPELRRQSCAYHAAWRGAGLPGDLVALAGHDHFSVLDELIRPDGALTDMAVGLAVGPARA